MKATARSSTRGAPRQVSRGSAHRASGRLAVAVLGLFALLGPRAAGQSPDPAGRAEPSWQAFLLAGDLNKRQSESALEEIGAGWDDRFTGMLIDVARFLPSPRSPRLSAEPSSSGGGGLAPDDDDGDLPSRGADFPAAVRQPPGADVRQRITSFLQKQTGKRFGDDLRAWRQWIWSQPAAPHRGLARFKAELYARVDPRFRVFFPEGVKAGIRLDEVDWGGVGVNGIPPLHAPKRVSTADATYLRDNHVVFGIEVNGEARAYPKRILAWHELATDSLGGVDLTIVYCTLCGTVIPYESRAGERRFTFGTSGLLYRSNKLMFDQETGSLWSALEGVPVVGSLVGSGLRLTFHAVVTTTWGEWKRDHPHTTVLSLDTGFQRNYDEGAAYREYFATDRTMFETPVKDTRLKNKAEVLVLRPEVLGPGSQAVAIAVERLRREAVYGVDAGGRALVVITSRGGANRVYERGAHVFRTREGDAIVRDAAGGRWRATPQALVHETTGERLAAVAAHRVFWFGWVAQYPDTVLHK
ncbi:MAG: DUF3179 domain-containing protein [Vicinamibacterales bacterium]